MISSTRSSRQGLPPHTHRIQHRGLFGGGAGLGAQEAGVEPGLVRCAGVEHRGGAGGGDGGHLLRGLGHDGAGAHRQHQVGAVVGGDDVGDAVDQGTRARHPVKDGKIQHGKPPESSSQCCKEACMVRRAPLFFRAPTSTPAMMDPPTVDTRKGTT